MTILSSPPAWRQSSPTVWYVVFCETANRRWWDRVVRMPRGFSHVYALRWDGFNWLVFNPSAEYTDVAVAPIVTQNALGQLVEPGATVLEVEAFRRRDRTRGRWWIGPMTCVEQVKALLGLPVGRVWTPWQLYRYLVEHCGEQAGHARKIRGTERARAPATARSKRVDPRGECASQVD